jgi:hypothetical protein
MAPGRRAGESRPSIDAAHLRRQALGDAGLMAEILRVFLVRLTAYVAELDTGDSIENLVESLRILALAAEGVGAFPLAERARETRERLASGETIEAGVIEQISGLAGETAREAGRLIAAIQN